MERGPFFSLCRLRTKRKLCTSMGCSVKRTAGSAIAEFTCRKPRTHESGRSIFTSLYAASVPVCVVKPLGSTSKRVRL